MLWFGLRAEVQALRERLTALEAYTDVAGLEEQRRKVTNSLRALRHLMADINDGIERVQAEQGDQRQLELVPELTADELADARRRYAGG